MAIAVEQLKDFVIDVNTLKKFYGAIEEIKPEQRYLLRGSFVHPLGTIRSIMDSTSDATKLNIDFRTKVESKNVPMVPDAVSTNVQFNNEALWSQSIPLNVREVLNKTPAKEERAESTTKMRARASKDVVTERNKKNATTVRPYVVDIKDTLRKKFAKASIQLETSLGTAKLADADRNARKTNASVVNNRAKRERDYIRLCRRLIGPTATSIQKLFGRDCVRFLRSEFYLEQNRKEEANEEDSANSHVGLKIRAKTGFEKSYKDSKEGGSDQYKQHGDAMVAVDASISDSSSNY